MPSAVREPQFLSANGDSSPATLDHGPRKSHEKGSIGNTFLWTGDANPDDELVDCTLKHAGLTELNGQSASSLSTGKSGPGTTVHARDSSWGSSVGGPRKDREPSLLNGWADGRSPHEHHDHPAINGINESGTSSTLQTETVSFANELSPSVTRTAVNSKSAADRGRISPPDDKFSSDIASPSVTPTAWAPEVSPGPDLASQHATPQTTTEVLRHSSPPAPVTDPIDTEHDINNDSAAQSSASGPTSPRLGLHRQQTLQVPKFGSGRKSFGRDWQSPNTTQSEDNVITADRGSSSASGIRRTSLSLVRRSTRSIHSDQHLDELPLDEDAARWADAIKHRRVSKRRRREEEDDDRVIVGTKVDQNHVNWVTAYNMLTGIRFTVSRTNAKMDRELTNADFEAKHKFSFDITGNELTPSAKYDFKFKDYAPWVFRRLRAKFRLDPADYLMSLTSKYILSELGSPGKSGSFFYFSRDYKYIIKTIHHAEHKLLRKILREYYQHIENNPNTLISQFYGLHRVKMAYGRKIHFVVMNNLFPPHRDIHQMFDLKGSTVGRDFREDDVEKNRRATLKDLNWLRRQKHLECGPAKRQILLAQLKRDVALLQRLKIMDYSLLVGIHDMEKGNEEKLRDQMLQVFQPGGERSEDEPSQLLMRTPSRLEHMRKARELREIIKREKPVPMAKSTAKMPDEILDERKHLVFYSDNGGFRATHENGLPAGEIYYLGMIDCLTHYGLVKKAEHFWKGLSHNRHQISPVPPDEYGERFINFITASTKSQEEVEREKQSQDQAGPSKDESQVSPAERAMERAEKDAFKSRQSLLSDPEPREHVLSTVQTSGGDISGGVGGGTVLPVVEEVGESGSTRSNNGNGETNGAESKPEQSRGEMTETNNGHRFHFFRRATSPSTLPCSPPPSREATLESPSAGSGKGKERLKDVLDGPVSPRHNHLHHSPRHYDKDLPPLPPMPNRLPPSPPSPVLNQPQTEHEGF